MTTLIARCAALWRNLTRRTKIEADLNEELRSQVELLVDEYTTRGVPREEAERRAHIDFGGVDQVKEGVRSVRRGRWLDEMSRDIRYGSRSLLRNPTFTVVSILTIALGIGVNTTIFTIVNGAFRPFTLPSGDPLMSVTQRIEGDARRTRHIRMEADWVSYEEYQAYRDGNHVLAGLAAYAPFVKGTLTGEPPRTLTGALVSCNYFDVLEVRFALGRGFINGDCAASAAAGVVLSDDTWRTVFASDPQVIGRTVTLDRRVFTIIGIAAPEFMPPGPVAAAFWAPLSAQPVFIPNAPMLDDPEASWLAMLARPRKGIGLPATRAELNVIGRQLDQQSSTRRTTLVIEPARMFDMPQVRIAAVGISTILLVTVALVLVVACANVANMLFARSAARRREIAVRLALGASRWRLIRQLLTESLLLAAGGGIVGLVLAVWSSAALLRMVTGALPVQIPRLALSADLDVRVLTYVGSITALTALCCGLLPALRASRPDLSEDLKQECGEPASHARSLGWWRHLLLASQMFVSMVLLLAGGLLARGLYQAQTIDPGFRTDISVVSYDLDASGYNRATAQAVQRALVARLSTLPAVTIAQAWVTPLSPDSLGSRFSLDDGSTYFGSWNAISSNYFSVLGMPIVRGRGFTAADERDHAGVAIVTEATARRFWPGADPIGQTIRRRRLATDSELDEVVGVVKDAQVVRLGEADSTFVYVPVNTQDKSDLALLVSREGAVGNLVNDLRAAVREVDPQLVVTVSTLDENLGFWRGLSRIAAIGAGGLAGLALALAAIGAYGVVAFTVSRRTREMGIRVALGATNRNIMGLILRQTMRPVIIGAGAGTLCAAAVSKLLSALLFGLSPYDPLSFTAVPLILLTIAAVASYLPARRATRVDPLIALRYE